METHGAHHRDPAAARAALADVASARLWTLVMEPRLDTSLRNDMRTAL